MREKDAALHFENLAAGAFEQGKIGTGHPGLGGQGMDFLEQGGAAHLDPARRTALFAALSQLGPQVFMTGADPLAFSEVSGSARIFEVDPGTVRALE